MFSKEHLTHRQMAKWIRPRDEFEAGPVGPHNQRNEWTAAVYLFVTEILRFTPRRLQEKA
jgi:hypothetical protein